MSEESSPAATIRAARERLGLEPEAIAAAAGLNDAWYFDVESYDSEVTSNISLRQLGIIAEQLGLAPLILLDPTSTPERTDRTLSELMTLAAGNMQRRQQTVEEFSETVGWEMAAPLADPDRFREYTFDALVDLCRVLRVDWREFLLQALSQAG